MEDSDGYTAIVIGSWLDAPNRGGEGWQLLQKSKAEISDFGVDIKIQGRNQRFQCFYKNLRPKISDFSASIKI